MKVICRRFSSGLNFDHSKLPAAVWKTVSLALHRRGDLIYIGDSVKHRHRFCDYVLAAKSEMAYCKVRKRYVMPTKTEHPELYSLTTWDVPKKPRKYHAANRGRRPVLKKTKHWTLFFRHHGKGYEYSYSVKILPDKSLGY